MPDYFVCENDCVFNNQRWYPGDKMPASLLKGGPVPKYFVTDAEFQAKKKAEEREEERKQLAAKKSLEFRPQIFPV